MATEPRESPQEPSGGPPRLRKKGRFVSPTERFRQRLRRQRGLSERPRRDRRRPAIPPVAVPSFFTLMNLLSGFLALTQIADGNLVGACWLIVLAGFFDLLDGLMARLTGAVSDFGVQLDSLSDVVSFGAAPGFMVYTFGLEQLGPLGVLAAALPPLCGAVRLARFNVTFDGEKKDYFEGLPIPMQAIALVALVLNFHDVAPVLASAEAGGLPWLVPVVVVLAGLMVSNVPFDAAPKPTPAFIREHPRKAVLYTVGLLLVLILQALGLLIVLAAYLLHGIGRLIWRVARDDSGF